MTLAERLRIDFARGHARPIDFGTEFEDPRIEADLAFAPAAVLVAITDRPEPGLILTQRSSRMRKHAGQVAFPGGRVDETDADETAAALREAQEEIGLDPGLVEIIGVSDRYHTFTGFDIVPVVAVIPPDLPLVPHEHEVEDWFELPLAYALDPAHRFRREIEWLGQMRHFYEIMWEDRRIWGVTAAILAKLASGSAMILPDAEWRHRPGLDRLLGALGAADGGARFVGGAVRDTLLGQAVKDVDIATVHAPLDVLARLKAAEIKAVPTGVSHGTVTAVLEGWPVEVTTLRRDVDTDGRRATVAFTDDWQEDASRRDFTINALYADPATGRVIDYFDGEADLKAGRIRFIGRAEHRIAEDHLRILRFFRFFARFGRGEPDAEGYAACVAHANSLMALSRERIADELMKLLALDAPVEAMRMMVEGGVLAPILPEIDIEGVGRLTALIARERAAGIAGSAARRLAALVAPGAGEAVAARLKLSTRLRKRIALAQNTPPESLAEPEALAYRVGTESAIDLILLDAAADVTTAQRLTEWERPALPFGGGLLIDLGLRPGPAIASALRAVEDQWMKEGFPGGGRPAEIAAQIVSKFQRAVQ